MGLCRLINQTIEIGARCGCGKYGHVDLQGSGHSVRFYARTVNLLPKLRRCRLPGTPARPTAAFETMQQPFTAALERMLAYF